MAANRDFYHFDASIPVVTEAEAREFLKQFRSDYNRQCFDNMINQCKKEILNTIVKPFGLGHLVAAYDKTGGNVDTVHNVRQGVYATEREKQRYENREQYDSKHYHSDERYIQINAKHSAEKKSGESVDYLTGEKIAPNQKTDLDHVVSAHEIHNDPGRILAEVDGRKLANTESNLKPTDSTYNRSKGAKSMTEFIGGKNQKVARLEELKAKSSRTPQEEKELEKLEKFPKIDDERALAQDKASRKATDWEINKAYYISGKFIGDVAKTGAKEGAKMGLQQAIGTIMVEFFSLLFDEAFDIYKHGFKTSSDEQSFLNALKERIKRIAAKLKARWKELSMQILESGIMGTISGFISNLATVLINTFITTSKRVARIIREGFFSLFKAIKLMLFPPKDMTREDALHEAKKLLATGVIVSIGVYLEGQLDLLIKGVPLLGTIDLSSILISLLTAFATALAVYYLDKKRNDKKAIEEMIKQTHEGYARIDMLLNNSL